MNLLLVEKWKFQDFIIGSVLRWLEILKGVWCFLNYLISELKDFNDLLIVKFKWFPCYDSSWNKGVLWNGFLDLFYDM